MLYRLWHNRRRRAEVGPALDRLRHQQRGHSDDLQAAAKHPCTEQIAAQDKPAAKNGKAKAAQPKLDVDDTAGADETAAEVPATAQPAQLAFSLWRVNDYDLQIQHNEAVELACQHLGVTRTKGDSFFEGTRGQSLVKIVPFNHPLSPLDLEQSRSPWAARPDETRPVLMVCLGVELAAQGGSKTGTGCGKDDPNRIDYIELRTDPKYGKFFQHKPCFGTGDGDARRQDRARSRSRTSPPRPSWSGWRRRRAFSRRTLTTGGRWWTAY